jgi:SAM domain (Sterile alpha motif)
LRNGFKVSGSRNRSRHFRANEIDARVLHRLTAEDLKDLGVTLVGHRRRLLDAISALGAEGSAAVVTAAPRDAKRRQLSVMFCARLAAGQWREPTGEAANDIGADDRQAADDQILATRLRRSEP